MSAQQDALTAQVKANTAAIEGFLPVAQSAGALIATLKSRLDAAGTDPAALKALSDELGAEDSKLTAASGALAAAVAGASASPASGS